MLRFDLPRVASHALRLDAFLTLCVSAIALAGWPFLLPVLAIQGLVRGFFRHGLEPIHRASSALLTRKGWAGKLEDAGAKMFANKILCFAATLATILWLLGSPLWKAPTTALLIFSFMESAFSFCAGCWAYTAFYRLRTQS